MKKDNPDGQDSFYAELPQTDYLNDIEIQDEYENAGYDEIQGLSDEQVSEIARDSLEGTRQPPRQKPAKNPEHSPNSPETH